jgi:addiction module RelE/StbE family toxin
MVEIKWSESAKNDFKNIVNYISQDSPGYSEYFIKGILEKIEYLKDFPKIGRKVPESDDPNDRELIFQRYRIIYYVSHNSITIEMIIHGSRLLKFDK